MTDSLHTWRDDVKALFTLQSPPAGWRTHAIRALIAYVAVIVICLIGGPLIYGDRDKMFGEKQLCTYANVAALITSGVLCFQVFTQLRGRKLAAFWLMFGVLMCMTALDDLVRIHERLDLLIHKLLHLDPKNKVTDHIDDVIVLAYALPAVGLALWHFQKLIRATLAAQLILVAMASFLVHVAMDILHFPEAVEECFKLLTAVLLVLAFLAVRKDERLLAEWRGTGFDISAAGDTPADKT